MEQPIFVRRMRAQQRKQLEAGLRSASLYNEAVSDHTRQCERRARLGDDWPGRFTLQAQSRRSMASISTGWPVYRENLAGQRNCARSYEITERQGKFTASAVSAEPPHVGEGRVSGHSELAAEVCWEQGVTGPEVSIETIRQALMRLGVNWQRAKHWITSADTEYALKKSSGTV